MASVHTTKHLPKLTLRLYDGRALSGRVNYANETHVELIDATGDWHWIERAQILTDQPTMSRVTADEANDEIRAAA